MKVKKILTKKKVYCNMGSAGEKDLSLDWLIDCLNTLPDNELKYVLDNLRMGNEKTTD